MRSIAPVFIGLAHSTQERKEALEFVDRKYLEIFDTTPPPAQILFVATQETKIVGTMGIDFGNEEKLLRLERIYQFNPSVAPFPVIRNLIIEYGRWIVTVPGISGALIYVATVHALSKGRVYGWCEHTDDVHRAAARFSINFHDVPEAKFVLEEVEEKNRIFYADSPPLKFYMMLLSQIKDALEPKIQHVVKRKRIILI